MQVRCSNWKHCPLEHCPHWKEHKEFFGLEHIGGSGRVKTSYCRPKHTCGLVTPWVEVECLPVETERSESSIGVAEPVPA
jgi:hypothetical protein